MVINSFCQDPNFSQFYNNSLYFNPANAGIHGGIRMNLSFRDQWHRIPSDFNICKISFDTDLSLAKKQMGLMGLKGFGLIAYTSIEGEGLLRTSSISINNSVIIRLSQKIKILSGYKLEFIQKSIDWSKLVFSDQLDQVHGKLYPTAFNAPTESNVIFPDLSMGIQIKYETDHRKRHIAQQLLYLGFAVHHITQPDQSFTGLVSKLPIKYIITTESYLTVKSLKHFWITPGFLYQKQGIMESFTIGTNLFWNIPFTGIWYRSENYYNNLFKSDALIFVLGTYLNKQRSWSITYSYDITISGLQEAVGSTNELSLVYRSGANILKLFKGRNRFNRKNVKPLECPPSFYYDPKYYRID
jgi:type IX secretion system PorP/SprF family membrane protein